MTVPVPADSPSARMFLSRLGIYLLGGAVIFAWLVGTPDGLLGKADAIGYAVCHRIDVRSFHLGVRTLPLCSRCSGMYLGVLASFIYFYLRRRKAALFPPKHLILILSLIFIGYVIDGINSYFRLVPIELSLYEPSNLLRLTTGFLFGIVLSSFVYPAFNQSAWREPSYEPALRSLKDLLSLIGVGLVVVLVVVSENPLLLYPLAILSSVTVLILLSIVYTMIIMMVFKGEKRADDLRDLSLQLFVGLTFAIAQIGLFDLIRYSIFGTWSGFHFG